MMSIAIWVLVEGDRLTLAVLRKAVRHRKTGRAAADNNVVVGRLDIATPTHTLCCGRRRQNQAPKGQAAEARE